MTSVFAEDHVPEELEELVGTRSHDIKLEGKKYIMLDLADFGVSVFVVASDEDIPQIL